MGTSKRVRFAAIFFSVVGLAISASRATIIAGGNIINQTWTPAGSPYIVQGDITVPAGAFLNISAGTIVQFASSDAQASGVDTARVELIIKGTLTVSGTAASPVSFQAQSGTSAGIWYGIEPNATATSVSIDHAQIRHAVDGIQSSAVGTVLSVTNTTFDTCTTGIANSDGTPTFDSIQTSNGTNGFVFSGKGSMTLKNVIANNNLNYGILASAQTGTLNVTVVNSTFSGNPNYALYGVSGSGTAQMNMTAQNLIVTNNGVGFYRGTIGPTTITVTYSDVWTNSTNYLNVAPGTGVISANPAYVNSTNFHLNAGSVAIDSGNSGPSIPTHDFDGNTRPLDGDGIGGAQFDMGAYEYVPAAVLGSVPEAAGGSQPVLTIGTLDHVNLSLQWGATCGAATDYAVYEGTIGSWYSHVPGLCTTSGSLSASYAPAPGNTYYLVVPLNASAEGIYGHSSSGTPIPVSGSACRAAQNGAGCP